MSSPQAELRALNKALEHARDARLLIEAEVPRRQNEANRRRDALAALAQQLAGVDVLRPELFSDVLQLKLMAALRRASDERDQCQASLAQNQSRLSEFTRVRERSLALAQQLRSIADAILEETISPDECPLCHTQFGPGELEGHIHSGLDAELDPIAHVDDFNALSFLDYLRDVVIAGNRQIFFATANDKIAALFERKFDFLGDDYQRINLSREIA